MPGSVPSMLRLAAVFILCMCVIGLFDCFRKMNQWTKKAVQDEFLVPRGERQLEDSKKKMRLATEEPQFQNANKQDFQCAREEGPCCATWEADMDSWWFHRPEWEIISQNETGTCFSIMQDPKKIHFTRQLHKVQWNSNCSAVYALPMINSGYGASITWVQNAFWLAFSTNRPMQMTRKKETSYWRFAAYNETAGHVCKHRNNLCYFLPYSNCKTEIGHNHGSKKTKPLTDPQMVWLKQYMTREQQWLRKRLYHFLSTRGPPPLPTPCVVIHVRRTDVNLEDNPRRRRPYYPLSDYLTKGQINKTDHILLLTDDRSTIEEAHAYYPEYNWYYINRTRFRGAEGGFNQHMPSKDPTIEVLSILAETTLAKQCHTLIHSRSGFANHIYNEMASTGKNINRISISVGVHELNQTTSAEHFFAKVRLSAFKNSSISK